ncbi:uncharacterized protein zgc:161969 isoform X2 [Acipenser ruthenus]|uniref:uncharacterized protein zgc:161969 isoform X2 n=1 Tax=Acipenser ruthenus TaxID=7906 RepID=UPI002741B094|nr:uncharacterized protein zgc:161969 isoform X2 [Acipenser ruthenus]
MISCPALEHVQKMNQPLIYRKVLKWKSVPLKKRDLNCNIPALNRRSLQLKRRCLKYRLLKLKRKSLPWIMVNYHRTEDKRLLPAQQSATMCLAVRFQHWRFRNAFTFKEEKGKNILVECNLCRPKEKVLSTSKSSTSNLKKHLERVHAEYCKKTVKHSVTLLDLHDDRALDSSLAVASKNIKLVQWQPVQPTLHQFSSCPSQETVDRLIMDFIIEDAQAFNIVEQPSFINLVKGLAPNCRVMCRQTLAERVDQAYENMKVQLKAKFEKVHTVCTTADIWRAHGRSFLGVTAHWLDSNSVERHSVALACCRITGPHTYNLIAAKLEEIHAAFEIHTKVCCTITDNGYNFKAFKEFANFPKTEGDQAPEDEEEDTVMFSDLNHILTECTLDDAATKFSLPHQRCAAHTLNLVAAKDAHDFLSTGPLALKMLFQSTIAKCSALWNKSKMSPQVYALFAEKATTQLKWNLFFRACSKMRSIPEEVLHNICDGLNVERLGETELTFLDEYCSVMEPLACALDILQGESKCFIGYLLPTISALQTKLGAVKHKLKCAGPMADAVLAALQKRFGTCFEDCKLILASITIPQFRMRWMNEQSAEQAYGYLLSETSLTVSDTQAPEMDTDDDEFFQFDSCNKPSLGSEDEVFQFFRDGDKTLSCVLKYPVIKQVFITYNTPLPSSAPVERMFSIGGRVLTPSRNQLSDVLFEKMVLLRFNKGEVN